MDSGLTSEYVNQAHEMLEAIEVIHRVVGNTDEYQHNVMIEVNPVTGQSIRPQILDLGDTFIFWEKRVPVNRAPRPELIEVLYGPYAHLQDRRYTHSEIQH
ncbi:MAG: hypothetical protein V4629_05810 [Pseudomonadota bacterium]